MRTLLLTALLAAAGCSLQPVDPELACGEFSKITVFADNDGDGYGTASPGSMRQLCEVRPGYATNDDDCDDFRAAIHPGAIEQCDGIDNDCDAEVDENLRDQQFYLDADGDGWGDPDAQRGIMSCAPPLGYVDNRADCDDANAGISPDGVEVCDELDNNCNGRIDDDDQRLDLSRAPRWHADFDRDSFGDAADVLVQCVSPGGGRVLNGLDCDDRDSLVHPGAGERCNKYDDDCDQLIDDSDPDLDPLAQKLWYADNDLDGAGDPDVTTQACFQPWFHVGNANDCDDDEPLLTDPAPWLLDGDRDGFGAGTPSIDLCDPPAAGWVLEVIGFDCNDTNPLVNPLGNEVCDGQDNDCNSLIDDADPNLDPSSADTFYFDFDDDTFGDADETVEACAAPAMYVVDDTDCNDLNVAINPNAAEICDGIDNDCDNLVDDADPNVDLSTALTWYSDFDTDGFGDASVTVDSCGQPPGWVSNSLDCDDTDPLQLVFGPWYDDGDGDGVGAGAPSADSCTAPTDAGNWVSYYYGIDCDDTDGDRFPGNTEICANGVDENCDGIDPACFAPSVSEVHAYFSGELVPGMGVKDAPQRWLEQFRIDDVGDADSVGAGAGELDRL